MKLIIDIPEERWIKMHNFNIDSDSIVGAVANGTPVSTDGDLISREALKKDIDFQYICKCCHNVNGNVCDICHISEIEKKIDNAPTVDVKTTHDVSSAYDRGFITAMKLYSRPQGEWILIDDTEKFIVKCSVCGRTEDSRMVKYYPFCHCGARMKGEERRRNKNISGEEELYEAYKGKPSMLGDAGMDMIAQAIANGTPYEERSQGEWIPVSERLPEEKLFNPTGSDFGFDFEEVLCTTIWGDVRTYKFGKPIGHDKPHFWLGGGIMDEYVIAWQYKPEPYKKGGTE